MRRSAELLGGAAALAMLAACGSRDEGRAGLTADQERELNEVAEMLDDQVIDASPDSLTVNESDENAAAPVEEPPPPLPETRQ